MLENKKGTNQTHISLRLINISLDSKGTYPNLCGISGNRKCVKCILRCILYHYGLFSLNNSSYFMENLFLNTHHIQNHNLIFCCFVTEILCPVFHLSYHDSKFLKSLILNGIPRSVMQYLVQCNLA